MICRIQHVFHQSCTGRCLTGRSESELGTRRHTQTTFCQPNNNMYTIYNKLFFIELVSNLYKAELNQVIILNV